MTRKQKLLLNGGIGLAKQVVVIVCGFILPRYMLLYYGSEVNGLVSSISHFLGFISLLEMGIGPVIQANLYRPLANKDDEQISKIIISSERFFRRIAIIFLIYIAVLTYVFPACINTAYDAWFSASLLLIISISTFAEYFFGATYQLLLNADQKAYISTSLSIVTTVLNTLFCIVAMRAGASIHVVKLVSSVVFVLRPIGYSLYVHRHYSLNKRLKLTEEPIKQKWNGFAQHIAGVVCRNTDIVILTLCSTLTNVSVYSVYYSVTNGLTAMVMTAAMGLESYFGNMIAKEEKEALEHSFVTVEWVVHFCVTILFSIAAITIVPFVSVYTRGITDANYIVPPFGMLLVLAYAAQCLRVPYFRVIKAAGHFKETQNGAFVSTALNVVLSIALVFPFGLAGIAFGTLIAMLYHTCYFVWYLRKNILIRSPWHFIKYIGTDVAVLFGVCFVAQWVVMEKISYIAWVLYAIKITAITVVISAMLNLIVNRKLVAKMVRDICHNRKTTK